MILQKMQSGSVATRREGTTLRPRAAVLLVLLAALLLGGCGGGTPSDPRPDVNGGTPAATGASTAATVSEASTSLVPAGRCAAGDGFSCATLTVPLSRTGRPAGEMSLPVAVQRRASAPRGVLLVLAGGPGQGGLALGPAAVATLGDAIAGYRVVVLDQRGTGSDAVDCQALQEAVGSSDLAVPHAPDVEDCARRLGSLQGIFGTGETVADLEALRVALGAPAMTLYGISYGTYVAERYAIAHPDRTRALLLDSVVPASGVDALQRSVLRSTARVLRATCAAGDGCAGDPVDDLRATLARGQVDGPALLDAIVARTIGVPRLADVPGALHAAARGSTSAVDTLLDDARAQREVAPAELSAGTHAAVLCSDARTPWGSTGTLPADREQALAQARDALAGTDLGGWDAATATGNGLVRTCASWAPLEPGTRPPTSLALPRVPTLLLAGRLDLSTPLLDARAQAAAAPGATLVTVPGAGHGVLLGQRVPCALRVARRFLEGASPGRCPAR